MKLLNKYLSSEEVEKDLHYINMLLTILPRNPMSYFTILIEDVQTKHIILIEHPVELPQGRAFKVIEINPKSYWEKITISYSDFMTKYMS